MTSGTNAQEEADKLIRAIEAASMVPANAQRIAIVGSREYKQLDQVREYVRSLPLDVIVISGGARGVDRAAETEARKRGLAVEVISADWDRLGKIAGFQRNQEIVDRADKVVAFWDGHSRGTADTMARAKRKGIEVDLLYASGKQKEA